MYALRLVPAWLTVVITVSVASCAARTPPARETSTALMLGETKITIRTYGAGNTGPLLVRVHENEITAKEAALESVRTERARFVDIEHGAGRDIRFRLEGKEYAFDPNRMFTRAGIAASLRTVGKTDSPKARREVEKLASAVKKALGSTAPIIAVHNNTGEGYGVRWYERGGPLYLGMHTQVARGTDDTRDFIIVTNADAFELLAEEGHNVVFQDPARDIDDGSMSYYFGSRGRMYFNVEAGFNDLPGQRRSLLSVFALLGHAVTR